MKNRFKNRRGNIYHDIKNIFEHKRFYKKEKENKKENNLQIVMYCRQKASHRRKEFDRR